MNKFITADLHLDDEEILKYCRSQFCRPNPSYNPDKAFHFYGNHPLTISPDGMKEHNNLIKDNWNRLVKKQDKVIILGDFAFNNHAQHLSDLNGRKILVRGTHDAYLPPEALAMFHEVHEWIMMMGVYTNKRLGQIVYDSSTTLCHYPMRSWPGSCSGSQHLYGHSHGSLSDQETLLSFDVGVDVWGYIPVPWDVIVEKFRIKKESIQTKGYVSDSQERTAQKQNDPVKRMIVTREKNIALARSMGISFDQNGSARIGPERQEKIVEAVVASVGVANRHGRVYDEESLKNLVDGESFFWDENKKSLILRVNESVVATPEQVAELFKNKLNGSIVNFRQDGSPDDTHNPLKGMCF